MPCGRVIAVLSVVLVCGTLTACDEAQLKLEAKSLLSRLVRTVAEPLVSDLDEATFAMRDREWQRAEKHLERFLITAKDPEERWQAWQKLLEVTERGGQDKRWISDSLEAMLLEFQGQPEKQQIILRRMAENQESVRDYDNATASWLQWESLPGLSAEQRLEVYQRIATLQMRNKRLQGAEGTLHECLSLPLPDYRKAECYYNLAELNILREELEEGTATIQQLLDMEKVSPDLHARATFLLADILQQKKENAEALKLFKSIRDIYPNSLAVAARIAALEQDTKK